MIDIEDYRGLDWTKTNRQLAKETKFPYHRVRAARMKLGKPKAVWKWSDADRKKISKIKNWASLNWQLQDTVLGHRYGVSRERVRQMRRELRKPNPPTFHKWTKTRTRNKVKA